MRSLLSASTIAIAFALPILAGATPTRSNTPRRPDLNAFVNHKVVDTRTLVDEVKNDPAVADRYMRLFKMSKEQVIGFLGTLHRESLANSAEYPVYSAPPGTTFKLHREVLKKGTPVFADSEGRPTLIVKCGNPLRIPERFAALDLVPPTSTDNPVVELPEPRDADVDGTDEPVPFPPVVPELALPAEIGPADIVALTRVAPLPVGRVLPYLGLAPLLAPIFGSSSHGGSNIVIFPTPEPASFTVLGLGAVAMIRRRRKA